MTDLDLDGDTVVWVRCATNGHRYDATRHDTCPDCPPDQPDDTPAAPSTLGLRWVADALGTPPEEPKSFVKGFLQAGELTVVAAPRALGKSWFTYNLAALLSRGEGMFLSRLPVENQARVLIAQGEVDEYGSWSRWNMMNDGGTPPVNVAESWDRWRLAIRKTRYLDSNPQTGGTTVAESFDAVLDPKIRETIVEHGFDVFVIDPWAVFFAGNENSNDEVEAALTELRHLSRDTGVAIVIVHHISKVQDVREPEDLWRGASRLADWASTRVTLLPHYKREDGRDGWRNAGKTRQQARRVVDVHFLRRSTPTDDFTMEWDPRDGWWKELRIPAREAREAATAPVDGGPLTPDEVARRLAASGGRWPSKRAAAEGLGFSRKNTGGVDRYLDAAVAAGTVIERTEGNAKAYYLPAPTLLDAVHPLDGLDAHLEAEADAWDPDLVDLDPDAIEIPEDLWP